MTAQEVKARRAELQERRCALEERLEMAEPGAVRGLRMELAGVAEDINECNRQLRELMPRHRVARRRTWGGINGEAWDSLQYQTWAEVELAEEQEGPTERDLMRYALKNARDGLTETQRSYMDQVSGGKRNVDVARETGRNRSTISRTVSRARRNLERDAKSAYRLRRAAEGREGGRTFRLDLSEPEHMAALLERLTVRQQLYMTLYYGEWMSLREIGRMLAVDHTAVLRGLRRGLERLEACFGGETVQVDGMDALEDLLMAYYNQIPTDKWITDADKRKKRERRGGKRARPLIDQWVCLMPEYKAPSHPVLPDTWMLFSGRCGKLRNWLEQRREQAAAALGPGGHPGRAVWRLLTTLFQRIKTAVSELGNPT